jgi:hypothetical protein
MFFKSFHITSAKKILFTLIFVPTLLLAQKTDIITLKNGDNITGELKELQTGLLELSTDNMGTIYIEWDKITDIKTDKFFEVELTDGRIYYGSFQPGKDTGMIEVRGVTLEYQLFMKYIVSIRRIKESFWDILDGYIKLGGSYNKGSAVAELSFGTDIIYTTKKRQLELILSSVISATEGNSTSKNQNGSLTYSKYLEHKWFWGALVSVNQNTSLGLNLRANIGASVGNDFIQTNKNLLNAQIGIVANREWYTDQTEPQNNLTGLIATRFQYFIYESPGIYLDSYLCVYPYFTDFGRIRINYNLSFDWEIVNNFFWDLSFLVNYDNKPQSEDADKVDYNFEMGLKYSL